jgi:tetratricopeptide (TPR) repeat protein
LSGFVTHQEFPFEAYQRGLFHTIRREMEPAAGWLAEAVRQSNGAYYEIYLSLGQVLDQLGERDLARQAFARVLEEDPQNRIALKRIGGRP